MTEKDYAEILDKINLATFGSLDAIPAGVATWDRIRELRLQAIVATGERRAKEDAWATIDALQKEGLIPEADKRLALRHLIGQLRTWLIGPAMDGRTTVEIAAVVVRLDDMLKRTE